MFLGHGVARLGIGGNGYASKYSPQGKTIDVTVRQAHSSAIVEIEDHGVGILKKDQPKLFKKFLRVNNPLSTEVGGSGLGLYWAKKVVTMHKGSLTVQSKIRRGSTFTVTLPLE